MVLSVTTSSEPPIPPSPGGAGGASASDRSDMCATKPSNGSVPRPTLAKTSSSRTPGSEASAGKLNFRVIRRLNDGLMRS
eukprot:968824-Prorocentrum_minimum.AAC.2